MTSAIFLAPLKIIGAGLATFTTCSGDSTKQNPCREPDVIVESGKTVVTVHTDHFHIHKHENGFITNTTTTTSCSFDFPHEDYQTKI